MSSRERVLLLLAGREQYWDLRELARAAGQDGAPMAPQRLRAILADIEAGPQTLDRGAAGVKLARPIALEGCLVEHELGTRRVGASVLCFGEVGSTNEVALGAANHDADGLAVLAESQSAGRGRLGRTWLSPPGANVLMSVLLTVGPSRPALAQEALTVAAGLAVAEAIAGAFGLQCRLKWPNDVLLDGRKVAGVLVEARGGGASSAVVVGIGVNVNAAPPRDQTAAPATCLAQAEGAPLERLELVRWLLRRLDAWTLAIEQGRFEGLRQRWLERSDMLNRRVRAVCGGHEHVGRVLDVSPLEGLHLCRDDGRCVHLPAATTTMAAYHCR